MTQASPRMRAFAERLIAYETMSNKSSTSKIPAAFHVCEKLRPHLATLMGNAGFRALLSRALVLANAEVPWLRAVHVGEDGSLNKSDVIDARVKPAVLFEGSVVLLAQLLGLLAVFIGENLTLRLLGEIWPKLSLDDLAFRKGDKNEKPK